MPRPAGTPGPPASISRIEGARGGDMIEMRRAQLGFGDGLITEEVSDLREHWMTYADQVLADAQIIAAVYEALAKRHPKRRNIHYDQTLGSGCRV